MKTVPEPLHKCCAETIANVAVLAVSCTNTLTLRACADTTQVGSVTHDVAVRVAVGPRGGVYVVGQLGLDDAPLAAAPAFLGRWDYLGKHSINSNTI